MLRSYSPIGEIIFLSFNNPIVLDHDNELKKSLEELVFSLKDNIKKLGIGVAQREMEDSFFQIRFQLLEYLMANQGIFEHIETILVNQIGEKYFTVGKFTELGKTVSDTLEVYLQMFSQVSDKVKVSDLGSIPQNISAKMSLNSLRHINALQPNPELSLVIDWFAASVKFDFFLLASEFIIRNEITIKDDELSGLIKYLKDAIVDFGVYTQLSGFWQPIDEDGHQLIRNIKIRSAAYRINAGMGKRMSVQNLQTMLLS